MSPAAWLCAALLACIASAGFGWRSGLDHGKAAQADVDKAVEQTRDAAQQGAANAIAKLEIKNVTIRQQAQTVVREVPVYRDCRHDKRMFDAINAALTGAEPAGNSQLPAASAPDR